MVQVGITFEVEYADPDLIEIVIRAGNGTFSGAVRLYTVGAELTEAAGIIAGFPRGLCDVREFAFGRSGPEGGTGAARFRFSCTDSAGHACVEAMIEADEDVDGIHQRATVAVPVHAASIDRFVEGLRKMASSQEGSAVLEGVG